MRPVIILIILVALLTLRLTCDGYYYATGQDVPWQGALTLALVLAPILNIRQDAAETGEPAHGLWATSMVTFPLILVVMAGVFWLSQHVRLDLGLSPTQIERATRVLCDVGYAAAGAIMLRGWRHARRTPPERGALTQQPP